MATPPSPAQRPSIVLTCVACGRLHAPARPLGLELHPICPSCTPPIPRARRRLAGPLD